MKELLRTQDPTVILYAKTVLDSVGITSFEADVNISNLYGVLPRRLLVVDQEFDAALEALISNGVDADYSKFNLKVGVLNGGAGCFDHSSTTDYGPVKARLTNTSLVSATDTSTCNAATRMVGSIDLNTPLIMTDNVKAYQLTWIIRDMGLLSVDADGNNAPVGWGGGPFVPVFTLFK